MTALFPVMDDAAARFGAGDYAQAIPVLQKILAADPHNLDAALRLATCYSSLGRDALALETFQRAAAIAPNSQDVRTYLALHYARTEDSVVRFVLQSRRPTVWAEGGYAERLGLPPVAQGTGMSTAEAQAFRLKDIPLFKDYMQKVWASTEEFVSKVDAADLEMVITVKPLGDMPKIRALGQTCLCHGMTHVGEIELARTLVGAGAALGV